MVVIVAMATIAATTMSVTTETKIVQDILTFRITSIVIEKGCTSFVKSVRKREVGSSRVMIAVMVVLFASPIAVFELDSTRISFCFCEFGFSPSVVIDSGTFSANVSRLATEITL